MQQKAPALVTAHAAPSAIMQCRCAAIPHARSIGSITLCAAPRSRSRGRRWRRSPPPSSPRTSCPRCRIPSFPFSYNRVFPSLTTVQLRCCSCTSSMPTSPAQAHTTAACACCRRSLRYARPPCSNRSRASGDAASDRRPPGCLQRLQVRTLQRLLLHIYIHFRCHRYHRTMSALTFLAQVSRLLHQLLEL